MSQCKVLVVDDERDFLESVVRRLQRRGLEAQGAGSGMEALKLIAEGSPDVVVLDVKMPDMDGIATLRAIKSRDPKIEVILLTGHASVGSGVEGVELGAFDYMIKPVKLDDLIERIRDARERGQLMRRAFS